MAFIAYCVVGMVVMRVKYDKTGTDVIPNKGLWFSLPSLVKVILSVVNYCVFVCMLCICLCVCMNVCVGVGLYLSAYLCLFSFKDPLVETLKL